MKKIWIAILLQILTTTLAWSQSSDQNETKSMSMDPMVIQEIQCRGNKTNSCQHLSSFVRQQPGDPITEDQMKYAKFRLSSLIQLKSVDIHLEKGALPQQRILVIEVEERDSLLKESSLSLHSYNEYLIGRLAGRVTQTNFLESGKILSAQAVTSLPLNSGILRKGDFQVKYLDPSLLGSSKYYFYAMTSMRHSRYSDLPNSFVDINEASYEFFVGRTFFDFAYIGIGKVFYPIANGTYKELLSDGSYSEQNLSPYEGTFLTYGINLEDDLYFPTQGSRFELSLQKRSHPVEKSLLTFVRYRNTWTGNNGEFWTFGVGNDPGTKDNSSLQASIPHGLSLRYAKNFIHREYVSDMERGRWYVEAGVTPSYSTLIGFKQTTVEAKSGFRFESKAYGIVDLFALMNTHL